MRSGSPSGLRAGFFAHSFDNTRFRKALKTLRIAKEKLVTWMKNVIRERLRPLRMLPQEPCVFPQRRDLMRPSGAKYAFDRRLFIKTEIDTHRRAEHKADLIQVASFRDLARLGEIAMLADAGQFGADPGGREDKIHRSRADRIHRHRRPLSRFRSLRECEPPGGFDRLQTVVPSEPVPESTTADGSVALFPRERDRKSINRTIHAGCFYARRQPKNTPKNGHAFVEE